MSLYTAVVSMPLKSLESLKGILVKAQAFAAEKEIEEGVMLEARLALDQFPLVRQVQIACDNAKGTAARLAGMEPPKMEDTEKTFAELEARIEKTLAFLRTFSEEQFEGSEERKISIYFMPGKYLFGLEYVMDMALPNFYFHVTTAYDILRHYGVNLGKADYIGSLQLKDEE